MVDAPSSEPLPRWLADEMVGRLARYLRIVGHDTEYARGLTDDEILRKARDEHRRLLTRDRTLAARFPDALLLPGSGIEEQLRAVRDAIRPMEMKPRFDRCTLCNGPLRPQEVRKEGSAPDGVPPAVVRRGSALWRCTKCGHWFWEGSHTESVRRNLSLWLSDRPA